MARIRRPAGLEGIALSTGAGLLYALAQPDRGVWPLAFLCLTPLLVACRGRSGLARAGLGALAGTVAAVTLVVEPIGLAIARYFDLPVITGYLASFALGELFGALPFALFAWLLGDPDRSAAWALPLRAGAAWAVSELARSELGTGLPWGLLGYALAPAPALAQSAAWGGVAGLGFLLAACNACLATLLIGDGPGRARAAGVGLGVAALLGAPGLGGGSWPAPRIVPEHAGSSSPGTATLRVALIQGALERASRRSVASAGRDLRHLLALSARRPADLVVWPESSLVVVLPTNAALLEEALRAEPLRARALLLGAPRAEAGAPGPPANAALLIDPSGRALGSHDKLRRVPFAEYVPPPFSWLGLGPDATRAGRTLEPLAFEDHRLGVLVCYEVIFPGLARELVRRGADLLINISNDEWFGGTRGIEQHFAAAVMRAIETRRTLLRATNTGVTAAIAPDGRVVARLPEDRPGTLLVDAPRLEGRSASVRWGDWVWWGSLLALVLAAPGRWRQRASSASIRASML